MFQLTTEEFRSIQKIKNREEHYGGQRKRPYVFTENGVAMLSGVLNSERAILINISIMRIFTKLRSFLLLEKGLNERIDRLESNSSKVFKIVFERLDNIEGVVDSKLPMRKKNRDSLKIFGQISCHVSYGVGNRVLSRFCIAIGVTKA